MSDNGSLAQVEGSGGEKTDSNYIFGSRTNGTCWKLADKDEEKKGIKDGFHVWDFCNWSGNILPRLGRKGEEQILKKKIRNFTFMY